MADDLDVSREVDKGKVGDIGRTDSQLNWVVANTIGFGDGQVEISQSPLDLTEIRNLA